MKLLYFKGVQPNFGDHLNPWLWSKLLPDFFDEDDSSVFIGIGSIFSADFVLRYGPSTRKIVLGAGFVADYFPTPDARRPRTPDVRGTDWDIYFVRGPRTASALNLSADLALGDPAILIRSFVDLKYRSAEVVSFMPHWESLERGNWTEVCRLASIHLIDPRRPVDVILHDLLRSKLVIAEAMHGAIVADALRIPWIPIVPMNKIHRKKWFDWAESLAIDLHSHRVCPSSLLEARLSFMRKPLMNSPFAGGMETLLIHTAAHQLHQLAKASPCLSEGNVIDLAHEKMLFAVEKLKQKRAVK